MSQIIVGSNGGGGGGGTTSFQTDSGVATPIAGVIQVLGDVDITTAGAGNIITVTGAISTALDFDGDSGTATPVGNTINIVGGANVVTSATGSTVTIDAEELNLAGDTGLAIPLANTINIVGGTNVTTSATGDTVTINATGGGLMPWVNIPSTPITAAINTGYVNYVLGNVSITLPGTAPFGSIITIVSSDNISTVEVNAATGQDIQMIGLGTTSVNHITINMQYGTLTLLCTQEDVNWQIIDMAGNWQGSTAP